MSALLYGALTLRREQAPTRAQLTEATQNAANAMTAAAAGTADSSAVRLATQAVAVKAEQDAADAKKPPDLVDVVAALVPAEIIAAHALIVGAVSTKSTDPKTGEVTTSLNPAHLAGDARCWWILVGAAAVLYLVGHVGANLWATPKRSFDLLDLVRMFIPALAFGVWTMVQQGTLFDAVDLFDSWSTTDRAAIGAIVGLVLIAAATLLAYKADAAVPENTG